MQKDLKKIYFAFLLPSILGFAIACWAKTYDFIVVGSGRFIEIAGPLIFILCITLAIAFPIFYRTLFAHKRRDLKSISEKDLLKLERMLINIAMITPYLALVAFILEPPRFFTAGAILMGLYAVYYFYPSKRRIAFDRKIFRAV
jgi:hypothetical protein